MSGVYRNRQTFSFEEHFAAIRAMSTRRSERTKSKKMLERISMPQAIFVASDSTVVEKEVYAEEGRAREAWGTALNLDSPVKNPPIIQRVNQSLRIRFRHGSHTVASDGACVGSGLHRTCALPWDDVSAYKAELAPTGESYGG